MVQANQAGWLRSEVASRVDMYRQISEDLGKAALTANLWDINCYLRDWFGSRLPVLSHGNRYDPQIGGAP
jgi:hypothetical protein